MTRLILQPMESYGREQLAARNAARSLGVTACSPIWFQQDDVPVGDVPFCSEIMQRQGIEVPKPDFYPAFLQNWMYREWQIDHKETMASSMLFGTWFVKSADEFKASYLARVRRPGEQWPDGRFIISDVVRFTQEWRYYIADGKLVTTGWYDGDNEDEPAPELEIEWPTGFCGAVDFGRLDTGEIALVESHHPFACGWYGDDPELFVLWLIEGWESLKCSQ